MAKKELTPQDISLYFYKGSTVFKLKEKEHSLVWINIFNHYNEVVAEYNAYVADRKKGLPQRYIRTASWIKIQEQLKLPKDEFSLTISYNNPNHPILCYNGQREIKFDEDASKNKYKCFFGHHAYKEPVTYEKLMENTIFQKIFKDYWENLVFDHRYKKWFMLKKFGISKEAFKELQEFLAADHFYDLELTVRMDGIVNNQGTWFTIVIDPELTDKEKVVEFVSKYR